MSTDRLLPPSITHLILIVLHFEWSDYCEKQIKFIHGMAYFYEKCRYWFSIFKFYPRVFGLNSMSFSSFFFFSTLTLKKAFLRFLSIPFSALRHFRRWKNIEGKRARLRGKFYHVLKHTKFYRFHFRKFFFLLLYTDENIIEEEDEHICGSKSKWNFFVQWNWNGWDIEEIFS